MNINECIEQLNSLLEHFENGGNDFNATDVVAIKNLLEENKKLNGAIQTYDILLKSNVEENKQLKERYSKLENQQKEFIKWLENMLDDETDIFSVVRVKDVLSKYKEIIEEIEQSQQENKKYKDNWNKLKSWADYMHVNTLQQNNYGRILDKMQELEKGSE